MPPTIQRIAAPNTSDSVTGTTSRTAGTTFQPRLTKEVRSRVMNSLLIILRVLHRQRPIEAEIQAHGLQRLR